MVQILTNIVHEIARRWRKVQRNADRMFLFHSIYAKSMNKSIAQWAIFLHIKRDPAWRYPEEWLGEPVLPWEEGSHEHSR